LDKTHIEIEDIKGEADSIPVGPKTSIKQKKIHRREPMILNFSPSPKRKSKNSWIVWMPKTGRYWQSLQARRKVQAIPPKMQCHFAAFSSAMRFEISTNLFAIGQNCGTYFHPSVQIRVISLLFEPN
jgi:hypothetical protein